MKIELRNVTCTVSEATSEEIAWLRAYLTFADERKAYVQKKGRRAKRVDPPKLCLLDAITYEFPAGLLPLIVNRAGGAGLTVLVEDRRPRTLQEDLEADLAWLRPYQLEAVRRASSRQRGIIWVPVGGGKTEIAIGLTRLLPGPWTFIVHRAGIMNQTAERYALRNEEHGLDLGPAAVFGDGRCEVGDRLTVATFQTVRSRLAASDPKAALLVEQTKGLIVDELHTLPAESYAAVAARFVNAHYRIGMSGTPLAREDKRSLIAVGATGPVIYRITAEELIEAGVLSRPKITMVPVEQHVNKATFQGTYGEGVVRSVKRNRAVVDMVKRASKPSLVFVKELRHGSRLVEMLEKEGMSVRYVRGLTDEAGRSAAKQALNRGDIEAVVASVVWQEGIDVPELRSIVVASGGKSLIAALQRIGRGMRKVAGKDGCEVWDVRDVGTPSLARHSLRRMKAYRDEGFEVRDVQGVVWHTT